MSDRGIKKWNAYKSLPEHDPAIRKRMAEKYKVDRPIVSDEEAEIINDILVNYHGEEVEATYYRNNELHYYEGKFRKIDPYERVIITSDGDRITLRELVGLKQKS